MYTGGKILPAEEPVAIVFSRTMSRGFLSLLLALCVALVTASDVLELDANSFESGVADKDIILVEFYAPWYELDCNQKLQIRFVRALVLNCKLREWIIVPYCIASSLLLANSCHCLHYLLP